MAHSTLDRMVALGLLVVPSATASLWPAAVRRATIVGAAVVVAALIVALWVRGEVSR